jgi:hypothetical protein
MRTGVLALGLVCLLGGCWTPLGGTTYPAADVRGIEGTWECSMQDDGAKKNGEPPVRVIVEIRPTGTAPGRTGTWAAPPADGAYTAALRLVDGPARDAVKGGGLGSPWDGEPLVLDGQFIRTSRWTLFSFQRSITQQLDWTGLSTPLQRTVRVERDGDRLTVFGPPQELYYAPLPMVGEFRFHEGGVNPRTGERESGLVANLDDVFATLDKVNAEQWRVMAVFERTVR